MGHEARRDEIVKLFSEFSTPEEFRRFFRVFAKEFTTEQKLDRLLANENVKLRGDRAAQENFVCTLISILFRSISGRDAFQIEEVLPEAQPYMTFFVEGFSYMSTNPVFLDYHRSIIGKHIWKEMRGSEFTFEMEDKEEPELEIRWTIKTKDGETRQLIVSGEWIQEMNRRTQELLRGIQNKFPKFQVLLLGTSFLSICVICTTPDLYDVIGCYLISLSIADMLCAIFLVPLSIYSSLDVNWKFFGSNSLLCKCSAYLQIALFCSTVYTLAWICIDRYSAMTRPSRYADQSLTRCKCWIVFSWLTSLLLCCPIVVAQMEVVFWEEAQLCVLNWSATSAYSGTLAVLVFGPALLTIFSSGWKIISAMRHPHLLEDNQRTVIETDPNFVLTMFLLIAFALSWMPLLGLKVAGHFGQIESYMDVNMASFIFVWLAIAGPSSKFLIYMFINGAFRKAVLQWRPCLVCCCPSYNRRQEYSNISYENYL
ncbi:unnamed protein product, partial [Mesorhabditis spiculigera]